MFFMKISIGFFLFVVNLDSNKNIMFVIIVIIFNDFYMNKSGKNFNILD